MRLTFCIPAYNDEKTIENVVSRAMTAGKALKIPFKIYVLNDGSTDRTGDILKNISDIAVFTHTTNQGYGTTIKELYEMVKTEWLFTAPGDYQIDPMEITKPWGLKDNADIIIGVRVHRQDGILRAFYSNMYHFIVRLLFGVTVRDINSVRLAKADVIHVKSTSAFVDAEMIIHAMRAKKKIIEVPIEHMKRTHGTAGGVNVASTIDVIIDILRTWKKLRLDRSK